ncbi:PAAR domain-containing protein, partial [Pseudomonas japonica]
MARSTLNGLGQGLDGDKTTTGATCISSLPNMSQEDRGVLRLGDKTTRCPRCGEVGVIAEGSQIFKWYDIPTALDGARIQCGCPVGSNRLIAIAGSPPAGTAPAASPRSAITPTSAQPAAQPAAAARSASPLSSTGTPVRPSTEDNEPVEPGFYIVPKSINRRALEAELFGDLPSPDVLRKFNGLNGSLGDDIVKAGQLVVLSDPRNNMCMREEAHLMQAAEETAEALRELAPEEADLMVKHQAAIAAVLGEVSTWVGVTTAV